MPKSAFAETSLYRTVRFGLTAVTRDWCSEFTFCPAVPTLVLEVAIDGKEPKLLDAALRMNEREPRIAAIGHRKDGSQPTFNPPFAKVRL